MRIVLWQGGEKIDRFEGLLTGQIVQHLVLDPRPTSHFYATLARLSVQFITFIERGSGKFPPAQSWRLPINPEMTSKARWWPNSQRHTSTQMHIHSHTLLSVFFTKLLPRVGNNFLHHQKLLNPPQLLWIIAKSKFEIIHLDLMPWTRCFLSSTALNILDMHSNKPTIWVR